MNKQLCASFLARLTEVAPSLNTQASSECRKGTSALNAHRLHASRLSKKMTQIKNSLLLKEYYGYHQIVLYLICKLTFKALKWGTVHLGIHST